MSQTTETHEFAPGFLWQISVLTIIVLAAALFGLRRAEESRYRAVSYQVSIFPWVVAGGHTIENGLMAFSGKPATPPPARDQAEALAAVLIGIVFCPTMAVLEWRRRRMSMATSFARPPLRITGSLYLLCRLVTLFVALAIVPIGVISEMSRSSLRSAQAVQSSRDEMINELNRLSVDAAQYFFLPKRLGGGGRSFEGFSLPKEYIRTEEAMYSVIAKAKQAVFHATSVRYPTSTIDVKVDTMGRMSWWKYGGLFE